MKVFFLLIAVPSVLLIHSCGLNQDPDTIAGLALSGSQETALMDPSGANMADSAGARSFCGSMMDGSSGSGMMSMMDGSSGSGMMSMMSSSFGSGTVSMMDDSSGSEMMSAGSDSSGALMMGDTCDYSMMSGSPVAPDTSEQTVSSDTLHDLHHPK